MMLKVDILALLDAGFILSQGLGRRTHDGRITSNLLAQPRLPKTLGARSHLHFEMPEVNGAAILAIAHLSNEREIEFYKGSLHAYGIPFVIEHLHPETV